MRRVLIIVDSFLAVLFGLCLVGLAVVFIEGRDDLDILVFLVVIGVPYGLLRFILLGNPIPFTSLPRKPDY